jgi:DHA1 family bicyclomycin/chloramphenicol resistance-like MFS transporter
MPSLPQTQSGRLRLILMLGGLSMFAPLSIDMYLPALPSLGRDLDATTSETQLTLSAFFLGLALGQAVIGPLSDALGRRRPLLVGLAAYVVASALCSVAPSIMALVGLRFVQGFAGAAGIVIARAIVRDLHSGVAAARFMSVLMLVSGLAPILGGQVLRFAPWQGLFVLLALLGGLLGLFVGTGLPRRFPRSAGRPAASPPPYPRSATCSPTAHSWATPWRTASPSAASSPTSPARRSSSRRSTAFRRRRSACCLA